MPKKTIIHDVPYDARYQGLLPTTNGYQYQRKIKWEELMSEAKKEKGKDPKEAVGTRYYDV